mgnify:CR=1 FL=1
MVPGFPDSGFLFSSPFSCSKNIESASDNFLIAGKLAIKENESQLVYSNLSILQSLALSNASAKLAYEELGSLTWQFLYQK